MNAMPLCAVLLATVVQCTNLRAQANDDPACRQAIIADLVRGADGTWRAVATPGRRYGVRSLFSSMLAYALAGTHPERIAVFIEKAEALQERDPLNRRCGNFFWYSNETEVLDANAVDFCMQHAALLWMFHRDKLDAVSRDRFHAMIRLGLQGLLRHLPRPDYTNIALLNASDLILLGEALQDDEAVEAGIRRLHLFIRTLRDQGVHEYVSPTYYGINLESALLLEALAKSPGVRQSAAAIRQLLETDIALNRIDNRAVLSGTCSRTYDFLFKRGELDQVLIPFGWMESPAPGSGISFRHRFFARLYAQHRPADETLKLSGIFPRTVTQRWGFTPRNTRVHHLCRDVSLSTSASIYGQMDIPLSVDLPHSGDTPEVQLYFLPDGRDDPYAKKRIAAGNHNKALHLSPWWCAVQERNRALALALYDSGTAAHITDGLQSHIVFRRALDALYINDRRIEVAALTRNPEIVEAGDSLFLRAGSAAVAIRIPWAQGQGGLPARTRLIDDGNPHGALRLSTAHELQPGAPPQTRCAGILYSIETGSGITTDRQFAEFRVRFREAPLGVESNGEGLAVSWRRADGTLALTCDSLTIPAAATVHPKPAMHVLALDGDDIGRRILEQCPAVREYVASMRAAVPIAVPPAESVAWPALAGSWTVPLEIGDDQSRKYLWVKESDGIKAWNAGAITWEIHLQQGGDFHIEAEILAPTPEDDSFFVSARSADDDETIPEFAWSTGVDKNWRWSRVICRDIKPYRDTFTLPQGQIKLSFRTREAGIKISRLRLVPRKQPVARLQI